MTGKIHTSEVAAANNSSELFPRRIVVLGNNICAWLSATMLARNMQGLETQVTAVSGDNDCRTPFRAIWTSSTLSTIVSNLGVDEQDMLRSCRGTYRLATLFSNWTKDGKDFLNPVGDGKKQSGSRSLYDSWQIQRSRGTKLASLHRFVPQASAADAGRSPHSFSGNSPLSDPSQYGYHVDALKLSDWFRRIALESGVKEMADNAVEFLDDSNGRTTGIRVASGQTIPVNFVLDCRQTTRHCREHSTDWIDLSNRFHCDRVIRQAFKGPRQVPSLTEARGMKHGWATLVPLHDEMESQYAFSSSTLSDKAALKELHVFASNAVKEKLSDCESPNVSELVHGRFAEVWRHNVIRMGPAAFEFEPLGATSIHLAVVQIELLLDLLGGCTSNAVNSIEYNHRIGSIIDETIDYAQLHHVLRDSVTQKRTTNSLEQRLKLYDANGTISLRNAESPSQLQWAFLLTGAGRTPVNSSWDIRQADAASVERQLRSMLVFNEAAIGDLPRQDEILDWIHSAPLPLEAG